MSARILPKYRRGYFAKGFRKDRDPTGELHRRNALGLKSGRGAAARMYGFYERVQRAPSPVPTYAQPVTIAAPTAMMREELSATTPISQRSAEPARPAVAMQKRGAVEVPTTKGYPDFDPSFTRLP